MRDRVLRRPAVGREDDPGDQEGAGRDQHRLRQEGRGVAGGEQRRPDRRPGELVERHHADRDPGVADGEAVAVHEHRQQRARGRVREDLGGAEEEEGAQHEPHRDGVGRHAEPEDQQHGGPGEVDAHHEEAPVEAVRQGSGVQPEEQRRQPLEQRRQGDHERVAGLRGDQQRAGGQGQAVAQVAHPGRGEQPAESDAEARRGDDLQQTAHKSRTLPPPDRRGRPGFDAARVRRAASPAGGPPRSRRAPRRARR